MTTCSPGNVLEELLTLLKLEKIEENIYRGQSQNLGFGNVFGGQVLGQALSAASHTVPEARAAHSIHAYFMRPGDPTQPIVYSVDRIRDGKSFTTRRIVALQKGQAIFSMSASFQIDEPGFDHQDEMPEVPGPENFVSELEEMQQWADKIAPRTRARMLCEKPIEFRHVDPIDPFAPKPMPSRRYVWFRAIGPMPDDRAAHRYMLAYASDFNLMATSLQHHGHTYWEPEMQVASLDHAMWFHRDFRMDDWMLYVMDTPNAYKARGLSIGRVFSQDGTLAATVAQEGLIRNHAIGRSR